MTPSAAVPCALRSNGGVKPIGPNNGKFAFIPNESYCLTKVSASAAK